MPGKKCIVVDCDNKHFKTKDFVPKISYHSFPKTEHLKRQWIQLCGHDEKDYKHSWYICSEHFTSDDYERDLCSELMNSAIRKLLKPNVVPSQKLPTTAEMQEEVEITILNQIKTVYHCHDCGKYVKTNHDLEYENKKLKYELELATAVFESNRQTLIEKSQTLKNKRLQFRRLKDWRIQHKTLVKHSRQKLKAIYEYLSKNT